MAVAGSRLLGSRARQDPRFSRLAQSVEPQEMSLDVPKIVCGAAAYQA